MSPSAIPARISIDFRADLHPTRTWILGLHDEPADRVELLAFERPAPRALGSMTDGRAPVRPTGHPTALSVDCACPAFCERDHANE